MKESAKKQKGRPKGTGTGVKKVPVTVMLRAEDIRSKGGVEAAKAAIINNFSVLSLLLCMLILGSCKKCGTCTTTSVVDAIPAQSGFPKSNGNIVTKDVCGDAFKNGNQVQTSTLVSGATTFVTTSTTTCK